MNMPSKMLQSLLPICTLILSACGSGALSNGPDSTINDFHSEVGKGNLTAAKVYLADTFMGRPKNDDRVTATMVNVGSSYKNDGGLVFPVASKNACEINGEIAKCVAVFKFKNQPENAVPLQMGHTLIKTNGVWLLRDMYQVAESKNSKGSK